MVVPRPSSCRRRSSRRRRCRSSSCPRRSTHRRTALVGELRRVGGRVTPASVQVWVPVRRPSRPRGGVEVCDVARQLAEVGLRRHDRDLRVRHVGLRRRVLRVLLHTQVHRDGDGGEDADDDDDDEELDQGEALVVLFEEALAASIELAHECCVHCLPLFRELGAEWDRGCALPPPSSVFRGDFPHNPENGGQTAGKCPQYRGSGVDECTPVGGRRHRTSVCAHTTNAPDGRGSEVNRASVDERGDLEDRQVEGDDHSTDDHTQECDEEWFDQ